MSLCGTSLYEVHMLVQVMKKLVSCKCVEFLRCSQAVTVRWSQPWYTAEWLHTRCLVFTCLVRHPTQLLVVPVTVSGCYGVLLLWWLMF